MNEKIDNPQRRRTLLSLLATTIAAPFIKVSFAAENTDLPHLKEDDPAAKALSYHHDATAAPRADRSGVPAKDQFCHNCQFIQSDSGEWRPCQIFPGKAVNKDGWCSSWVKQADAS